MRVPTTLTILTLLTLAGLVISSPYKDISNTSISVNDENVTNSTEALEITVERIDQLVADDGDLMAARVVDVVFKFDVNNTQLLLNGVPIELGLNQVKIDTALIANRGVTDMSVEDLSSKFDRGMATVDVEAKAEALMVRVEDLVQDPSEIPHCVKAQLPEQIEVRRIVIHAKVVEINGKKVVQTDMVEQVLDLFLGFVAKGQPKKVAAAMAALGQDDGTRMRCLHHRKLSALWHKLPHHFRVLIGAFLGSLMVLVFVVALPVAFYVHWKERRSQYEPVNTVMESHEVCFDKKTVMVEEKCVVEREEKA